MRKDNKRGGLQEDRRRRLALLLIFFTFVGGRLALNEKRVPQTRIARIDTILIEISVTSSKFNSETSRPCCQSSKTLTSMQSRDQCEKLITTAMKIFIEKTEEIHFTVIKDKMAGQSQ